MKLNKNTNVTFIHLGKINKLQCTFAEMFEEKIPLYISDDVDKLQILRLADKSVFIICNKEYYGSCRNDIDFSIDVWYNLLNIYFTKENSIYVRDICCAYWFGFNNTINFISKYFTNDKDSIKNRISKLEKVLATDNDIKLPSMDSIKESLRYIEVN